MHKSFIYSMALGIILTTTTAIPMQDPEDELIAHMKGVSVNPDRLDLCLVVSAPPPEHTISNLMSRLRSRGFFAGQVKECHVKGESPYEVEVVVEDEYQHTQSFKATRVIPHLGGAIQFISTQNDNNALGLYFAANTSGIWDRQSFQTALSHMLLNGGPSPACFVCQSSPRDPVYGFADICSSTGVEKGSYGLFYRKGESLSLRNASGGEKSIDISEDMFRTPPPDTYTFNLKAGQITVKLGRHFRYNEDTQHIFKID